MKTAIAIFSLSIIFLLSCKREHKAATDSRYGDSTVAVLPSGDSVIQDEHGNVIRTIYKPFGGHTTDQDSIIPEGIEKPYYIHGKLIGGAGANIILDKLEIGNLKPLYTQTVNKEELFDFEGTTADPQLMQMRVPAGAIHFIVKPGDSIYFELDLQTVATYVVKGSPESEQLYHIYQILEKANDKKEAIEKKVEDTKDLHQKGLLMAMRTQQYEDIDATKWAELKEYVSHIGNSYAALAAGEYLPMDQDLDFMDELDKRFSTLYPNTELYKDLHEKMSVYRPFMAGKIAPEILLPNTEGKDTHLRDFRGKVVLIDFWASWCAPCRKETPALKKLYDRYKAKGFEIFGVSLDNSKDAWVQAIKNDRMDWVQVSDLLGQGSAAAQTYIIHDIPTMYLLDRDGRIIIRKPTLEQVEKKLASIFKQ